MEGEAIWISDDLNGVASGNPQISSDGMYVFITHNADDKSNEYFTILDATTGSIFYSGSSGEAGDEPTNAYGPIGIFHTPEQGNYDPIETGALSEALRDSAHEVILGAVKTHLGHCEAAAGMAGLLAVARGLQQGPTTTDKRPRTRYQGPETRDEGPETKDQGLGTRGPRPGARGQRLWTRD